MRTENSPATGYPFPSPRRIKQEARKIRLQDPTIKQFTALNLVAQARGWLSYDDFERKWRNSARKEVGHQITLSARWVDPGISRGTFHAHVQLSVPWENHLPLTVRNRIVPLNRFHVFQGDRTKLVAKEVFDDARVCMHHLNKAARQLVFVDVMRVHPATTAKTIRAFAGDPHKMLRSSYPDKDHQSLWYVPSSGLHFILNEPYQIDKSKQAPVLADRQMVEHTTRDWSIHHPGGTAAQLIARAEDSQIFDQLVKRSILLPEHFRRIRFSDNAGTEVSPFSLSVQGYV